MIRGARVLVGLALAGCAAPSAIGERCASHGDCEPGLLCSNGAADPVEGGALGVCVLPEALRDAGGDAPARTDAPVDAGADAAPDAPPDVAGSCICDGPAGGDLGPPDAAGDGGR